MGRGGGHSHSHSYHSSSHRSHRSHNRYNRGSSGGESGPDVMGWIFLMLFIFSGAVALAGPLATWLNPMTWYCSPAESLNHGEQMVCFPGNVTETLLAECGSKGKDVAKVYKTTTSKLENRLVNRSVSYKGYSASISQGYDDFIISVPIHVEVNLSVSCSGSNCEKVELYWYNSTQFSGFYLPDGSFAYNNDYLHYGFDEPVTLTFGADGNDEYHLIFYNDYYRSAKITYDVTLTHTVYDLSGLSAKSFSSGTLEISGLKPGDAVVMDYPATKTTAENDDYFYAFLGTKEFNWAAIFSIAIIFGLIAIACLVVSVVCFVKYCQENSDHKIEKTKEEQKFKTPSSTLPSTPTSTPEGPEMALLSKDFRINDDLIVDTTDDTLVLEKKNLGDSDAAAIGEMLKTNRNLKKLNLKRNKIGPQGAAAICEGLKANSWLTCLILDHNKIGVEGAKKISDMLMVNSKLNRLSLRYCHIGGEGAVVISQALQHNTTLTQLNLSANHLGEDGVVTMSQALQNNKTLNKVDLSDNDVEDGTKKELSENPRLLL